MERSCSPGRRRRSLPKCRACCTSRAGAEKLRNVREPVELFAAVRVGQAKHAALPCDPVCRMAVDPDRAAGRLVYEDTTYFFCTLACAALFARHPERYAD